MGKKATQHEADIRREEILTMILDGYSTFAIVRFFAERYKIGRRQVEKYITQINAKFAEKANESFDEKLNRAIKRCERFRTKCVKAGVLKTAAVMIKEIHELEGLKIKRVDVTGQLTLADAAEELLDDE